MLIDKSSLPLVEMDFMNKTHLEDVDIINELYECLTPPCNKAQIQKIFEAWIEHTINHFKKEEEQMLKNAFPPYVMHKREHENALSKMREILQKWLSYDDETIIKDFLENENLQWLINHINTMDTVTARFLSNKTS